MYFVLLYTSILYYLTILMYYSVTDRLNFVRVRLQLLCRDPVPKLLMTKNRHWLVRLLKILYFLVR